MSWLKSTTHNDSGVLTQTLKPAPLKANDISNLALSFLAIPDRLAVALGPLPNNP
jgi:hypothetical protein